MKPRHADPVSFLHRGHASAYCRHGTNAFMTRYERRAGLYRPVAIRRVQVSVADTGGFDLYQDLTLTDLWHRNLIDRQWLLELVHHGCLHRFCHCDLPLCWRRIGP